VNGFLEPHRENLRITIGNLLIRLVVDAIAGEPSKVVDVDPAKIAMAIVDNNRFFLHLVH
jgi:hypothetical protein